ncbi:MAG TPA: polyketide cyclase [Gammaproteobacteria bacterium]|nr:polyketide cyclase [Gammaproteobacteria bacterium]HBF06741.1 polyketide cyclase [Gammaproteobacteria bacterium]HCK93062.1 polyketide cyclase [Gammaproteobacteria bacterium]|tara:strand:+ start:339 stop:836 length:498 start_codon:yes stop_codon:yes gene_type:complete
MNSIQWPEDYIPGLTDNFCSNEVIVQGLTAQNIWPFLCKPELWPTYYDNAQNINSPTELSLGDQFYFETFGFPVECQCVERVPPTAENPGRIAWHGWTGEGDRRLDVHHAWLIEDLSHNRVRILTQETQKGLPAIELASTKPNPMINGHQDWLEGLVKAAQLSKK